MTCPEPTQLETFCLGLQISDLCTDVTGGTDQLGPITLSVTLVNPNSTDYISDPSNCAIIPSGRIFVRQWDAGSDGCVCTCPLMPNSADDPNLALQPSGTFYRIVATLSGRTVLDVQFDLNLEDALAQTQQPFGDCGNCIDLVKLLPSLPTSPPTDAFCTAVNSCLVPDALTGPVDGVLTHTPIQGGTPTTHNLISGDNNNAISSGTDGGLFVSDQNTTYDLDPTIDPATGTASLRGSDGTVDPLLIASQDADNIVGYGTDGGLELTCDDVNDCVPDLVVTTNGNGDGVTQSGTNGEIVDLRTVSSDPDQVLTEGADGGAFLSCDDINGCVNLQLVTFDPAVHSSGAAIAGTGSAADPYQIPAPQIDVEIEGIAITGTVVNADGSTTVTYTVTESDDGDGDPATHNFDVVFPAAAELNFEYVAYDPAVHDAGNIEGTGTAADPWQVPLPPAETPLVITTDGSASGVTQSGTNGHTVDITIRGDDVDNILTVDPTSGGLHLDCGDVLGCVNIEFVDYDDATHSAGGAVPGSGTPADPFLVALPPNVVVTTNGTAAGVTQSGEGGHTVDLTILSTDAGNIAQVGTDGGLLLECDDVLGCVNLAYVAYDPAVHDAGNIEGAGTAADPFQIPIPTAGSVATAPAGGVTTTNGVTVPAGEEYILFPDGTSWGAAAGTTDTNTTYDLADNGNGSFTLTGSDGSTDTIAICDILDDLAANAGTPLPAGVQVLGSDCEYYDLPTDDAGTVATAAAALTTTNGVAVAAGGRYIEFPDGTTWAAPPGGGGGTTSSFTDNGDGSVTHTDGAGTSTTVSLCDLFDDLATGTIADGDTVLALDSGGACKRIAAPGVETPAGQAYPDTDGDGRVEVGLEDQDGVVVPGFNPATGEWNIPVDRVTDLTGGLPADPSEETGLPFSVHDTIVVNGETVIHGKRVWSPADGAYLRVLDRVRDFVIDSDEHDAATATGDADHPRTRLCADIGILIDAWVTADGTNLTAPVTLDMVVNGAGFGTAVIPPGQTVDDPIDINIPSGTVPLIPGSRATFRLDGDGNAGETISDITITYEFMC